MNKKVIIAAFSITILVVVGILVYDKQNSANYDKAYGNVDIRQSTLAFERSGKIDKLFVDEGDLVKEGDVLAILDTKALDHQIAIQKSTCKQVEASTTQTKNGYRVEEIAKAKANVETLKNSLKLAKLTNDRYQKLYKAKSISAQEKDNAYYTYTKTKSQLEEAQANLSMMQKGSRDEAIENAVAQYQTCLDNLNYLNYQKDTQSVIKAPFDGLIRTRLAEVADMTTSQSGVFELSVIDKKRVRVYLTELALSGKHVGDKAYVINAAGDKVEGTIAYISSTAMFTPKTVQTEDLRAELVYELRVDVLDPKNNLRLGQSVTVEFTHE